MLRVLDGSGAELARQNAFVLLDSDRPPGADVTGIVDALIERPPGAAAIELVLNGVVVDTFVAGSPAGAAALSDAAQIEATVADDGATADVSISNLGPAPEGVSYNIEISTDGGDTWQVVALNAPTPETTIDLTPLQDVTGLRIRISEGTGFETRVLGETTLSTQ